MRWSPAGFLSFIHCNPGACSAVNTLAYLSVPQHQAALDPLSAASAAAGWMAEWKGKEGMDQ